jgi:hypothetical protein
MHTAIADRVNCQATLKARHKVMLGAGGKVRSPPFPSLTYHLAGCEAKGSLGPIWDHLKLLYIERLMASSFLFFSL